MTDVKIFLFSYQYEGATWLLELKADNADDARRRITHLQHAQLNGELMAKIPTTQTASGVLGRVLNVLLALQGKR